MSKLQGIFFTNSTKLLLKNISTAMYRKLSVFSINVCSNIHQLWEIHSSAGYKLGKKGVHWRNFNGNIKKFLVFSINICAKIHQLWEVHSSAAYRARNIYFFQSESLFFAAGESKCTCGWAGEKVKSLESPALCQRDDRPA